MSEAAQWYAEVPRSVRTHALAGLLLIVVFIGGFGVWAFRAPLAAAVLAQGSFVATGQNKILQHLEGGIISELLVREGDQVTAGQPVLRLDGTLARANQRELFVRQVRLEATEARLMAQHRGVETLDFATPLADDPALAGIFEGQRQAFTVAQLTLDNDVAQIARNIDALAARQRGQTIQLASLTAQHGLLSEELTSKTSLAERGVIARDTVLALRRATLDAEGQIARMQAENEEIDRMREKYATQILATRAAHREAALAELQTVQAELESVREKIRKAEDVLARTDLTAPVSGTVVRLYYHTPGGVIEPGRIIAEILPADAPLIVETLILRTDIDSVDLGQEASIRMTGLNQRTTPILTGQVAYVSADAVATGEKTGRDVYVVRISLAGEELRRVPHFVPKPGMPVEVMIRTEERSFAQYLVKPVIDSMSRAFREQ